MLINVFSKGQEARFLLTIQVELFKFGMRNALGRLDSVVSETGRL